MVQLLEQDIRTREVLTWTGLHVFHAPISSCSQKLRIFLNLKRIEWESHPIDGAKKENIGAYYLGINPRGLVPAIVYNGAVHIESNEIIQYLDREFPEAPLIPSAYADEVAALLEHEDALHLDLRTLSYRFMFAQRSPRSAEDLESYTTAGSGTVRGEKDTEIGTQIAFHKLFNEQGISDSAARKSATKFRQAFDVLDQVLAGAPYIKGDSLSVLDIAWIVYVNRLNLCGYPLARLHPNLAAWSAPLIQRPEFARELTLPAPALAELVARQRVWAETGRSLESVCDLL
jgi:glutathione S-transferase